MDLVLQVESAATGEEKSDSDVERLAGLRLQLKDSRTVLNRQERLVSTIESLARLGRKKLDQFVAVGRAAASDEHGAGSPDDNPKCHWVHRVRSGFLSTSLKSAAGKSTIVFQHPDVNGAVVHGWTVERRTKA